MSEQVNLKELQRQQLSGEVKTIKANKNGDYEIAADEQGNIHVRLSRKVNNPATQSYDEQSRIESISPLDFAQMEKNKAFHTAGWANVEIIHDPRTAAEKKEAKK